MDEEQGLVSPIASGNRGIRRSVSSSIFGARPAVAQPDPQTTSLLQQNSLALNNLSRNLRTVSVQVSSLNNSLNIISHFLFLGAFLVVFQYGFNAFSSFCGIPNVFLRNYC